jgi:Na+-transporting methylmalonyl-CoA/oxaloacetate decarboxylase gamma subunit
MTKRRREEPEEAMSLGMTIVMLIAAWLAVAAAMLWGVMRISRRHHPHYRQTESAKPQQRAQRKIHHVTAH